MRRSVLIRAGLTACFCLHIGLTDAAAASSIAAVSLITPEHTRAIYKQLVDNNWVPRTGLFMSFPDSNDRKLSQQASTYEQGAMGLLALRMNDLDRARTIFRFFKEAWDKGPKKEGPRYGISGLVNFYNVDFASEGIEKRIHLGPNAWAGLFAARFANQTKDKEALQWALDVAYWTRNTLKHENGAVAMGPADEASGAPWTRVFSTENNLSYYAMLSAKRLSLPGWSAPGGADSVAHSASVDSAVQRIVILQRLGMDVEARFEIDALAARAESAPANAAVCGPRRASS